MSWLIILTGFISLSLFDFKKFLLPSRIVYSLVFITVISLIVRIILLKNTAIIFDPLLSAIVFFSFFYFILMFSRGEWIGGGDVRLAFLLGLQFTSPVFVFITLFLSSLFGLLFSLPMILKNRKKITTQIPFGPFLIFSAFVSVIWGERIIHWYTNLLR
jgi:prepilin signal peptidase PulO-like enzyme (type II secretory pathway)